MRDLAHSATLMGTESSLASLPDSLLERILDLCGDALGTPGTVRTAGSVSLLSRRFLVIGQRCLARHVYLCPNPWPVIVADPWSGAVTKTVRPGRADAFSAVEGRPHVHRLVLDGIIGRLFHDYGAGATWPALQKFLPLIGPSLVVLSVTAHVGALRELFWWHGSSFATLHPRRLIISLDLHGAAEAAALRAATEMIELVGTRVEALEMSVHGHSGLGRAALRPVMAAQVSKLHLPMLRRLVDRGGAGRYLSHFPVDRPFSLAGAIERTLMDALDDDKRARVIDLALATGAGEHDGLPFISFRGFTGLTTLTFSGHHPVKCRLANLPALRRLEVNVASLQHMDHIVRRRFVEAANSLAAEVDDTSNCPLLEVVVLDMHDRAELQATGVIGEPAYSRARAIVEGACERRGVRVFSE